MSNENAIRRDVGAIALMFTGLGSIIGSGWLFGAWRAAQLAGPGAVYAWIIGAVVILFPPAHDGPGTADGHILHGSLGGSVRGPSFTGVVSVSGTRPRHRCST